MSSSHVTLYKPYTSNGANLPVLYNNAALYYILVEQVSPDSPIQGVK